MEKSIPILYEKKEDCCGCGACLNICPQKAITMQEDAHGFIYPVIDKENCIKCGRCKMVCAFQKRIEVNYPSECYAAINNNVEQAKKSASGGIFAAIAQEVLEQGGVVYGAAFDKSWGIHHEMVETPVDLMRLQGSKYAHSDTGRCFSEVKDHLTDGKAVLYSGTPCQIAGLKEFLGKEYDNLLTVDIVCHGVPSVRMLKDYLSLIENRCGGRISDFTFRDKSKGWGINGSVIINGKKHMIWQSASSYLYYFTKGCIYRENCYQCKYASTHRPADITLGDYWGIEKEHPELLGKNGWDESKGVSCLLINTEKGKEHIKRCLNLELYTTELDKITKWNAQLLKPSEPANRDVIMDLYYTKGYNAIRERFLSDIGIKKYSSQVKSIIPYKIRRFIKSWI